MSKLYFIEIRKFFIASSNIGVLRYFSDAIKAHAIRSFLDRIEFPRNSNE